MMCVKGVSSSLSVRKHCRMPQSRFVVALLILFSVAPGLSEASASHDESYEETPTVVQIVAVVPTFLELSDGIPLSKWKEGEEILPGGKLALKEISNISNLLIGYKLELIPVRFPFCDYNEGIGHFVEQVSSQENDIVAVVGYFCQSLVQSLSKLLRHEELKVVQISAMLSTGQDNDCDPDIHSIVSLSEPASRAAIQLLQQLEWSTVAVVSNQQSNYIYVKDVFLEIAFEQDVNVTLELEISNLSYQYLKSAVFDQLLQKGVNIVVAFVSPFEAVGILCSAYIDGFKWPDYAWIFIGSGSSQSLVKANCTHYSLSTSVTIALNNSIFLHPLLSTPYDYDILHSQLNYSNYYNAYIKELEEAVAERNTTLQSNLYANVLYDSIWALALTLNRSLSILNERKLSLANISQTRGKIYNVVEAELSKLSFQGATGFLNFSNDKAAVQSSIQLIQFQNGQQVQLGVYSASLGQLILNETVMENIPSVGLSRVYVLYSVPLTVIITIVIVVCFALITVSKFLFFYYRKEPAIKATSSTLSAFMFIGCYLLLASSLSHNIISGVIVPQGSILLRRFLCMFELSSFGLGVDVIFATVIAKTLRIYHIFKKFGKVHHICSDLGLFVLISSIVSVKIILLILWTSLDPSHLIDSEQLIASRVPPYFLVVQSCEATYLTTWLILFYGYTTVLGLTMVLLAILTRKIRRSDYKDSKKINILVVVLAFNMFITSVLWSVLRVSGAIVLSRVVYGVGIKATAVFCLLFLILPKVVPLVLHKCKCLSYLNWRRHCNIHNETTASAMSQ